MGYLPAHRENVITTATGTEVDATAARGAAVAALLELIPRVGRCEYRLQVGAIQALVTPGLTERGDVDLDGLSEDLTGLLARSQGR